MNINDKIFDIRNKFMKNSKQYYVPGKKLSKESGKLIKLVSDINISVVPLQLFNIENLDDYTHVKLIIQNIMVIYASKMKNITKYPINIGTDKEKVYTEKMKQQTGGGMGGHAGALFPATLLNTTEYKDKMLFKNFENTTFFKNQNSTETIDIDNELFVYLFFLELYNKSNKQTSTSPLLNYNIDSLLLLKDIVKNCLTLDMLYDKKNTRQPNTEPKDILMAYFYKESKIVGKLTYDFKMQKYFTLGNLKKVGGDIIDYKIGCYTTNYSEKEINTLLSCKDFICIQNTTPKTTPVTGGGNPFGIKIDKVKKLSKIYNDILSTSNQYGFRCEGTDDTFYKIFNKYMFLSYTNNYTFDMNTWKTEIKTDTKIGIFVPNGKVNNKYPKTYRFLVSKNTNKIFNPDEGYVDDDLKNNYNYPYISQGKQSDGIFSTNYEKFILINKHKHFTKVQELFKNWSENLLKINITLETEPNTKTKLDMMLNCIKLHFSYVSYFNYDNNVIKNTVSYKSSLFNKAPNYYLHPLILYDTFYGVYTDDQSTKLQDNLNTMVTNLFLNQFTAILNGDSKVCVAFVGASIVTNLKTQDVRLIDFGHPVFFNAANLQYLVKHDSDNMLIPKSKQEDDKYREIFSIFMNYLYGGLSYYFMLSVYLGKTDKIDDTFIKYLYYATYYTQSLAFGFPLIDDNNKLSSSVYYSSEDEKKEGEYIDYETNLKTLKPKTTNNTIEDKIKALVTNIILPDIQEEQQFDTITSNNIPETTLTKLRCDITKYNYQLRFKYAFNDNITFNNSKYDTPTKPINILPTVIFDIDYKILENIQDIKPYHILMQRGVFKDYDIYINKTDTPFADKHLKNIVLIQTLQKIPNTLIKQINLIFEYINRGYMLIYSLYLSIFKCTNNNINYELDNDILSSLNSLFINFFNTINISMNPIDCANANDNQSKSNEVAETQCLNLQYQIRDLDLKQYIKYIKYKSGKYDFYVTHAEYTKSVFNNIIKAYNATRTAVNTIVFNPFIVLIIILITQYNNKTCYTKYINKNYIIKYPQNNVFDSLTIASVSMNIYDTHRLIVEIGSVISAIQNTPFKHINYIATLKDFINEYIKFIDANKTDELRIMFNKIIELYNSIISKNPNNANNATNHTQAYDAYFNKINVKLVECKELNTYQLTDLTTKYNKFINNITNLLTPHNASNTVAVPETVSEISLNSNTVSPNSVVTNNTNNVKQRLENFREYSVFKRLANNNGAIFRSEQNIIKKKNEIYNIFDKFLNAAVIDESGNNLYITDTKQIDNLIIVSNNATNCNAFFNNHANFKNLYELYKSNKQITQNSFAYHPDKVTPLINNEPIFDNDKVLIKYFFTKLFQNINEFKLTLGNANKTSSNSAKSNKHEIYKLVLQDPTYNAFKLHKDKINEDILDYAYDNYIENSMDTIIHAIIEDSYNSNIYLNLNYANIIRNNAHIDIYLIMSILKYIIKRFDTQQMTDKYNKLKQKSLALIRLIIDSKQLDSYKTRKIEFFTNFVNKLFE